MNSTTSGLPLQAGLSRGQLLLLFVVVFGLNLLIPRDLWVQDEARYGAVLNEMMASNGWLVPHLNGHPYPDKPPLYFWLVGLVSLLVGKGELAFRLVTTASTLLAVAGVYCTGRQLLGRTAAAWSVAVFMTCLVTLLVGQIVRMDMLLTAAAVFSWYGLLRQQQDGSRAMPVVFWLATAVAVAVKGPIALLFTLAPALVWRAWRDGWNGIRRLHLVAGLLILALLAGGWIAAVILQGQGAYLQTIWHQQLVGRAVDSWSHREPFYFYLVLLPVLLMPWTGLVVSGLRRLAAQERETFYSVLCFSVVPLLGISSLSGKLFIYVEPMIPALAIAAGYRAVQFAGERRVSGWIGWPPVLYLLVLVVAVVWLAQRYLSETTGYGYAVSATLLLLAVIAAVLARSRERAWLGGWLPLSGVLSVALFGALTWLINPLYSARPLGELLAAQVDSTPIAVVNITRGILNYYAGRTLQELQVHEAQAWWQAHPDGVLVYKAQEIAALFGAQGEPADCALRQSFSIELKEYHVRAGCR